MQKCLLLFFLWFVAALEGLKAQEAEMLVPVGHSACIRTTCYDAIRNIVATGAGEVLRDRTVKGCEVKLWEASTGAELNTLTGYKAPVTAMCFSRDGKMLAAGSADGIVKLWDPAAGIKLLDVDAGPNLQYVFFAGEQDRLLITAGRRIRIWQTMDGLLISDNRNEEGGLSGAVFCRGADLLALTGHSKNIIMYHAGKKLRVPALFTRNCRSLAFPSNDGSVLVAVGNDINLSGKIRTLVKVADRATGKLSVLSELPAVSDLDSLVLSADARMAAVWNKDSLRVYRLPSVSSVQQQAFVARPVVKAKMDGPLSSVSFLKGSQTLALGLSGKYGRYMAILKNPVTAETLMSLEGHALLPAQVAFSEADTSIIVRYDIDGQLSERAWSLNTGIPQKIAANGAKVSLPGDISGQTSILIPSPDGKRSLVVGTADKREVKLWQINNHKLIRSFKHMSAVMALLFFKDGLRFVSAGADRTARIWNVVNGQVEKTFRGHTDEVNVIALSADERLLATAGPDQTIRVWDVNSATLLYSLKGHNQAVVSLCFRDNGKVLASAANDYSVRLWDLTGGRELAQMYAIDSAAFMISTPGGYYMADPDATRQLHFKRGTKVYSFSQFDLPFNRPDKVIETMGTSTEPVYRFYRRVWNKRLEKMGFDPGNFERERSYNVPEVQILNKVHIPDVVTTRELKLAIKAWDVRYNLDRLYVYVNGVPLYRINGATLKGRDLHSLTQEVKVRLSAGRNVIEVAVLNQKGVESLRDQMVVNLVGGSTKPNLYVVAIGVSKYADQAKNLSYAAKDASDLSDFFHRKGAGFGKTAFFTLLNEDAGKNAIIGLKHFLQSSTEDDEVFVFYAGHGMADESLNYYLASYEMDFAAPAMQGILYAELEGLLGGIPARRKVLLIDACHSGEIDKEEMRQTGQTKRQSSFETMKQMFVDLRISTGATVIASTNASGYALEGGMWNNGVFTYCILEGLSGKKADLNGDGTVMLSEFRKYLIVKVPELTRGAQKPVIRMENVVNDFALP